MILAFAVIVGCKTDHLYPELDFYYYGNIQYEVNLGTGSTKIVGYVSKDTVGDYNNAGQPSGNFTINGQAVALSTYPYSSYNWVRLGFVNADVFFDADDEDVIFQHSFNLTDTAFTHFPAGLDTLWLQGTNILNIGPNSLRPNEFISVYVDYGATFGRMDYHLDTASGNYIGTPSPAGALVPGTGQAQIWRRRYIDGPTTASSELKLNYWCWSEYHTIVVVQ